MIEKYISASKLKAHYSWLGKDATLSPKDVDDIIDAQPAADVEPVVRGEWIEHYDECECPVCGETWNYCDNDTERFDCCPKCGARLVEHGKER